MVSSEKLIQALETEKAREKQLAFGFASRKTSRPYRLDVQENGVRLYLEVEDLDRLGVLLSSVRVRCTGGAHEPQAGVSLETQINRVANDIRCLSGDFQLIEKDTASMVAILRTPPPNEHSSHYFEMVLRGGSEISLRHYSVDDNARTRHARPANVSMESFRRLVSQLVQLFSFAERE